MAEVGRPSDYTPELQERAEAYLNDFDPESGVLPTIEGLALHLGISRQTVYAWRSEVKEGTKELAKPEFTDIVERVLATQSKTLIEKGLVGDFNASITKMMLGKHGYSDRQEVDVTSKGEAVTGINYILPSADQPQADAEAAPGVAEAPR